MVLVCCAGKLDGLSATISHVFPGSNRSKSEQYGMKALLCGDSCHRYGKRAAHNCKETADDLKRHFQVLFMTERNASITDFRAEFGKNYLDSEYYDDERSYSLNANAYSGRLTRDPDLRYTQTGKAVCSFRIAVDRPGTKDKVDFIPCVAWDKKAEFVSRYFRKGQRIEVSGVLTSRDYEKDGERRSVMEVRADQVFFGDSKKNNDSNEPEYAAPTEFQEAEDDGELPF